jgi:hypothetical protein
MVLRSVLSVMQLRTNFWRPYANVCKRCDHIIGFGSNAPW